MTAHGDDLDTMIRQIQDAPWDLPMPDGFATEVTTGLDQARRRRRVRQGLAVLASAAAVAVLSVTTGVFGGAPARHPQPGGPSTSTATATGRGLSLPDPTSVSVADWHLSPPQGCTLTDEPSSSTGIFGPEGLVSSGSATRVHDLPVGLTVRDLSCADGGRISIARVDPQRSSGHYGPEPLSSKSTRAEILRTMVQITGDPPSYRSRHATSGAAGAGSIVDFDEQNGIAVTSPSDDFGMLLITVNSHPITDLPQMLASARHY